MQKEQAGDQVARLFFLSGLPSEFGSDRCCYAMAEIRRNTLFPNVVE